MKQPFMEQAEIMRQPVILLEGTRKVPEEQAQRLHGLTNFLAASLPAAVFRSGNAQGADSLFFQGLTEIIPERQEYILPYPGSGKKRIRPQAKVFALADLQPEELAGVVNITLAAFPDLQGLVQAFLARGRNNVTTKAMYLLRDVLKVIGAKSLGLAPADFAFFFVNPDNPLAGGTGHTIRVCRAMGVAVYEQSLWDKWL